MTDKIIWVLVADCFIANVTVFWLLIGWSKQDKDWKVLLEQVLADWRNDVLGMMGKK